MLLAGGRSFTLAPPPPHRQRRGQRAHQKLCHARKICGAAWTCWTFLFRTMLALVCARARMRHPARPLRAAAVAQVNKRKVRLLATLPVPLQSHRWREETHPQQGPRNVQLGSAIVSTCWTLPCPTCSPFALRDGLRCDVQHVRGVARAVQMATPAAGAPPHAAAATLLRRTAPCQRG